MRRTRLGESDPLRPDTIAHGRIPDRSDNRLVGIRCRRGCRRRHICIIGRGALSALLCATRRSVKASK